MHNTEIKQPRAILGCVNTEEFDVNYSLKELENLCKTLNMEIVATIVQNKDKVERGTYFGKGKLDEIRDLGESVEADYIVVDCELTANQMRNIEEVTKLSVLDRTTVILDIFAQNAITKEGKIQVELAQYKYRLPRLSGYGEKLSRLGGGIGTRGPGETKLETDKRHIRSRIHKLEEDLSEIVKQRQATTKQRQKNKIKTVAIVGYTNVGKSTLLNTLTFANVLEENKLFATLDPTARKYNLPNNTTVVIIDTVGFISRLPHHLVASFKSTLEIAQSADLILNILDATSPYLAEQIDITENILKDIKADGIDKVYAINKIDKISINEASQLVLPSNCTHISAKKGDGLNELIEKIQSILCENYVTITVLIPFENGALVSFLKENVNILEEEYKENGVYFKMEIEDTLKYKVSDFII